jgi:hypothetical protein
LMSKKYFICAGQAALMNTGISIVCLFIRLNDFKQPQAQQWPM